MPLRSAEAIPPSIRRAAPADEAAVLALVPRLSDFGPPPWRDPAAMTRTDLKVIGQALHSTSEDPVVLVAELSGAGVVGFVHLHSLVDYYTERRNGHVADIVVARSQEGRGIGRLLLGAAEDWARRQGYGHLTIAVFEGNARAADLYRSLGFATDITRLLKPLG